MSHFGEFERELFSGRFQKYINNINNNNNNKKYGEKKCDFRFVFNVSWKARISL